MTLAEAIERSIGVHPQVEFQGAKVDEQGSAIEAARAPGRPQLDLRLGVGHGSAASATTGLDFLNEDARSGRLDTGASFRFLLYDFGATREDIAKNIRLLDGEKLKQYDKIEEISLKVAQAYLRIIETREMLAAADENVGGLRSVARLVNENMRNGNGTLADVKRVEARLIDAEAQRADLNAELQNATDQFRRLARIEPGRLQPPPILANTIPRAVDQALSQAREQHPKILTATVANRAAEHELAAMRASAMPRVTAEADAAMRNFRGDTRRSEADLRAMVVLRYRLLDGDLNRNQVDQIAARIRQGEARLRDQREEIEADIRQFYRSMATARAKFASLGDGVRASANVTRLYSEQFRGGKRTLFELLDAQLSLYTARRSLINAQFEERRAIYGVLRSTGRLTPTVMAAHRGPRTAASTSLIEAEPEVVGSTRRPSNAGRAAPAPAAERSNVRAPDPTVTGSIARTPATAAPLAPVAPPRAAAPLIQPAPAAPTRVSAPPAPMATTAPNPPATNSGRRFTWPDPSPHLMPRAEPIQAAAPVRPARPAIERPLVGVNQTP